jgi:hypothetical protein
MLFLIPSEARNVFYVNSTSSRTKEIGQLNSDYLSG